MRILFASSDFLPLIGGISLMVHGLSQACAGLGHEVYVLAPGTPHPNDASEDYQVLRDSRRLPSNHHILRNIIYEKGTRRELSRIVGELEPDAIVLGVYQRYGRASVAAGKRLGIPVAGLVHGYDILGGIYRQRTPIRKLIGQIVGYPSVQDNILMYLRDLDLILANSSVTSEHVTRTSGRLVSVIGCGVPAALLSNIVDAARARQERPAKRAQLCLPNAPTIAFLGRLVARKNVESILHSLKLLDDCHAVIIGEGPQRAQLQRLAEELGVAERTVFTGPVTEERKWQYLAAADALCLPSRNIGGYNIEGFGIVFLEAAVAGVPVVGGRSGGIPDVVRHEISGLLADPEDWRDIAYCLGRVIRDEQLADRCVAAAQVQLRERFNWTSIAKRLIAELNSLPPKAASE